MTATAKPHGGALPWIAFAVCCAIWSSTFLFIRMGDDTMPPVWAAGLRLAIATLLLTGIVLVTRQPWPRGLALQAALWFGFIDFGVSLPLLYWGELKVPSGVAAVLFATIPLITALTSRAFGLERLERRTLIAALLGIVGVAVITSAQMSGAIPLPALLAITFAAATAAVAGVMLKRAPAGSSPFAMNAVAHGIGAVLVIAISRFMHEPQRLPASTSGWVSLVYLTIVGSIIAFVAFMYLVQHWPATRASFISVVIPVLALALGVAVRGERLDALSLVGSTVVIAAVVIGVLMGPRPAANAAS